MGRKFSVSLSLTWVLCGLSALYCSSIPAQELRRIHYGTTTSTAHLPIWVAKDAGLFAKNSLNVEPVHIRGGALITMGIMSGQLQFSGKDEVQGVTLEAFTFQVCRYHDVGIQHHPNRF